MRVGQRVRVRLAGPFYGHTGRVFAILPHKFGVIVELDTPHTRVGALGGFNEGELEAIEEQEYRIVP